MTEKELNKIREKLRRYVNKWEWIITSLGWRFDVYYKPNLSEMPRDIGDGVMGICYSAFDYLEASIYFNMELCANRSDREIEELVVHELVHPILNAMKKSRNDPNHEYVTTAVSRNLIAAANGKRFPKPKPKPKTGAES